MVRDTGQKAHQLTTDRTRGLALGWWHADSCFPTSSIWEGLAGGQLKGLFGDINLKGRFSYSPVYPDTGSFAGFHLGQATAVVEFWTVSLWQETEGKTIDIREIGMGTVP